MSTADTPLSLIVTPLTTNNIPPSKEADANTFVKGASHMALLHNAILRGFNSIYLQAPHVKSTDLDSFISYILTWTNFVLKHHDDEENDLFPTIEKTLSITGVMDKDREEHRTFAGGLTQLRSYLETTSADTSKFDARRLIALMDSFKDAFQAHFHNEIPDLVNLQQRFAAAGLTEEKVKQVGPIFAQWGKGSMMKSGYTTGIPFLFYNFDRTVENGRWAQWPPMPRLIYCGLINIGGWWHNDWWRFASCDSDGNPRTLYALS